MSEGTTRQHETKKGSTDTSTYDIEKLERLRRREELKKKYAHLYNPIYDDVPDANDFEAWDLYSSKVFGNDSPGEVQDEDTSPIIRVIISLPRSVIPSLQLVKSVEHAMCHELILNGWVSPTLTDTGIKRCLYCDEKQVFIDYHGDNDNARTLAPYPRCFGLEDDDIPPNYRSIRLNVIHFHPLSNDIESVKSLNFHEPLISHERRIQLFIFAYNCHIHKDRVVNIIMNPSSFKSDESRHTYLSEFINSPTSYRVPDQFKTPKMKVKKDLDISSQCTVRSRLNSNDTRIDKHSEVTTFKVGDHIVPLTSDMREVYIPDIIEEGEVHAFYIPHGKHAEEIENSISVGEASFGKELKWDGSFLGKFSDKHIEGKRNSFPFWLYKINLSQDERPRRIWCAAHPAEDRYACIVDEAAPLFGLAKVGTHIIKVKSRLYIIYRIHGITPTVLQGLNHKHVSSSFKRQIQDVFTFRQIMGINMNYISSVVMVGDRPASYRNRVKEEENTESTLTINLIENWFTDVIEDSMKRLIEAGGGYSQIMDKLEKVILRVDPSLISMKVLIEKRISWMYNSDRVHKLQ